MVVDLRAQGFRFRHFHMCRPQAVAGHRYVVLVRDPVARFVSAFNWRCHLLAGNLRSAAGAHDPIVALRRRLEWEFLSQFRDVNEFAERLVRTGGKDISAMSTMMQLIGHVPQGFSWYLGDLLRRIAPEQLAGVITTERLSHDVNTLQELATMAQAANVPLSVRYDPQLGAIHIAPP